MKPILKTFAIILLGLLICLEPAVAQKEKEKDVVKKGKVILKKIKSFKNQLNTPADNNQTEVKYNTEKPKEENRESKKRKLTPPDVRLQINNANQSLKNDAYAEARFYVQQAILGIELEMGYEILKSMPENVMNTDADKSQDEVFSTGAGFAGMIVSREYPKENGYIKASVGNNSAIYSYAGMQASYDAQIYSGDDDSKVIRYKNNKAFIKVDDYTGYEMMVPFGQSSVFVLECEPCETEDQLMAIADLFDIEKYKSLLGEQ